MLIKSLFTSEIHQILMPDADLAEHSQEALWDKALSWFENKKKESNEKRDAYYNKRSAEAKSFKRFTDMLVSVYGKNNIAVSYDHASDPHEINIAGLKKLDSLVFDVVVLGKDNNGFGTTATITTGSDKRQYVSLDDGFQIAEHIAYCIDKDITTDDLHNTESGIVLLSNDGDESKYLYVFGDTSVDYENRVHLFGSAIGVLSDEISEDIFSKAIEELEKDRTKSFADRKYRSVFYS